jgi:MFS family permease
MESERQERRQATIGAYPWIVLGLLWFCGFFNYADRQAIYSVFPLLEQEFHVSRQTLGMLGSAFMVVYAVLGPFAGYVVDRVTRKLLIPVGVAFWSLICAATGTAQTFRLLLIYRAAEGLGESFYFPASMSLLSDYHGKGTRSKALGIHQTSVYLGTAGGAFLAGMLAEHYGWRSPFYVLGLTGTVYALLLGFWLIEPARGQAEGHKPNAGPAPADDEIQHPEAKDSLREKIARISSNRAAVLLLCVFIGANFVAATFLTWLPLFIHSKFGLSVSESSTTSTVWSLASLAGAICGGVLADRAVRRRPGGRIRVQSLGLVLGAPFVFLAGWSESLGMLVAALAGAGLCKGIYDANIFASLFDVIPPEDRGTGAGVMNTVGWAGGALAPTAIGFASDRFGLSVGIASTAPIYLFVGILALYAARLAEPKPSSPKK